MIYSIVDMTRISLSIIIGFCILSAVIGPALRYSHGSLHDTEYIAWVIGVVSFIVYFFVDKKS